MERAERVERREGMEHFRCSWRTVLDFGSRTIWGNVKLDLSSVQPIFVCGIHPMDSYIGTPDPLESSISKPSLQPNPVRLRQVFDRKSSSVISRGETDPTAARVSAVIMGRSQIIVERIARDVMGLIRSTGVIRRVVPFPPPSTPPICSSPVRRSPLTYPLMGV